MRGTSTTCILSLLYIMKIFSEFYCRQFRVAVYRLAFEQYQFWQFIGEEYAGFKLSEKAPGTGEAEAQAEKETRAEV